MNAKAPITPADQAVTLRLHTLRFGYRPDEVVTEAVCAELRPGRLTVLLGPNASGKTTLLKLMLGQLTPWSGQVELVGEPVAIQSGVKLAQRVAYVPQRGTASFGYSVLQTVAMGRFAHGDHQFIEEAMRRCGIESLADRPYGELSGGQQQRVLIARAWAQSRGGGRVVLADEPASSLDLKHAHEAMALLRELADEGLAVLVVLHGLELASRWADDVWLMDRGRLVANGPADEVLQRDVLEPVYGVRLVELEHGQRKVFCVEGPA